ncbi:hypothetical protein, partial [Staphylococcus warneri]|uniref:hypothetical protein n=1 Tax=Staphylococcus warneri TaxID=1292 RepID=UPI0011A08F83
MLQHPLLLNPPPTLHTLRIQPFQPTFLQPPPIPLHPLLTTPYNPHFHPHQIPLHLPLSKQPQAQPPILILAPQNILNP